MEFLDSFGRLPLLEGRSYVTQAAICIALATLAYNLAVSLYNIYFHPLRNIPGSKLHAASVWPHVWWNIRGRQPHWVRKQHARYGPVVRIGPNELSFTDGQAWRGGFSLGFVICGEGLYEAREQTPTDSCKDLYGAVPGSRGASITSKVPDWYATGLFPTDTTPINAAVNDAEHARLRKSIAPAFSDKALREEEPMFEMYIDLLVKQIRDRVGDKGEVILDILHWLNLCTFDIMAELTFGKSLGLLESGEVNDWLKQIFDSVKSLALVGLLRYFPVARAIWVMVLPRAVLQARLTVLQYVADRIDTRMKNDTEVTKPDVWRHMIDAGEKDNLTKGEIYGMGEVLLFGGSDTTATTMSGVFFLLAKHPDKMAKLVHEIRSAFSSRADMTYANICKLDYLTACIDESQRLYPAGPQNFTRQVRKAGVTTCGYFVPEGTLVTCQTLPAFLDEKYFRRATEFIPERWASPEFASDDKSVFNTFSFGPRNCPGKSMAYLEMRRIIVSLLWNFDIELCSESRAWFDKRVYFTWEHKPLMMKFKPVR